MSSERDEPIEVTDENFGDLLIQGLREVLAIERGEAQPVRRVRRIATARETLVQPPRGYSPQEIYAIRERLGMSQTVFAQVLNSSPETIKAWEQGKREPDGMALTLLHIADEHPQALLSRVQTRLASSSA
ncbi:MAG TPA: helix-turn-helix domain-containing protein [Longimicrobium sp.]|jgi:putative transcriptional regulator